MTREIDICTTAPFKGMEKPWPDARILELCRAVAIINGREDDKDDEMDLANVLERDFK